ncbi:MAG: dihydropteroate synthase, partial [Nitrospirota bacterium]|nr:dihydropteroate synthase [Nitrospirota bacterium]
MPPVLSICSGAALTVTVSGLPDEDAAHLQKLLVTSGLLFRPGFEFPKPGVVSIHGSIDQLRHCWGRLASHKPLPERIRALFGAQLDNYLRTDYKVDIRSAKLDLGSRTHIMGILNVTPDSFSDGGRYSTVDRAVAHAADMKLSGADIIDVGGESTRPGAEPLSEDEELARIIPVIERISRDSAVPLSVDTYKSSVAHRALKAGASMVNDISGLRFSPDMAKIAGDHGAAVVVMHIKGTPRDMQRDPVYGDVIGEITEYLAESIEIALKGGVRRDRIMIDPGIGFGKTLEHNLTILQRLDEFRILGCPIVLGTSRKRFIGTVLDLPEPQDRAAGTAATVALGVAKGAQVLRVHDVA